MRASLWFFTVLVTVLTSPFASAADAAWRLEKDKDGIQIFTRAVDGWSIREIRGVMRIAGRLSSVVAVIDDIPASRELTDVVSEATIPHRDSETRYQIYSAMKMPWPVSNRDILNLREITQDPKTLAVTITDVATRDVIPPKKGFVRIVESRQQWLLTPVSNGEVTVELRLLSDPAGPIPSSLINAMSVSTPFKTLTKLREMSQRPQYAQARPPFVREVPGS